jgi:hypothetical protein
MTHRCPQGHPSATPDFCSVCGTEIGQAVAAPAPPPAPAGACPHCDTPRAGPTQLFCEGCGYNFRSGAPGEGHGVSSPPAPATLAAPAETPAGAPRVRWDVLVRVDANLYGTPNPDAPADQPSQTFTLFEEENLIGRGGGGIRAHVPIRNDPGVSRRQALLLRQPDGTLLLRDLNSANGTQLNGQELLPGADAPVKDGDTVAIGAWTRLAVRAVLL